MCAVTCRSRNQSSDWGAKYANKREQNVQRPRDERERMALGAARSSTWNGGHRLEAYGVESRLQMCL